jgi:hypothetical protein
MLVSRFENGPIDWKNPPRVKAVVASMRMDLVVR